jgi:hypothetical protein
MLRRFNEAKRLIHCRVPLEQSELPNKSDTRTDTQNPRGNDSSRNLSPSSATILYTSQSFLQGGRIIKAIRIRNRKDIYIWQSMVNFICGAMNSGCLIARFPVRSVSANCLIFSQPQAVEISVVAMKVILTKIVKPNLPYLPTSVGNT